MSTAAKAKPKGAMGSGQRLFTYQFAKIYSLYVQKAERKSRTKQEVDRIICWLTGYSEPALRQQIKGENDLATFFVEAPAINPKATLVKGTVCGIRVQEVEDPLMQKIRILDLLIDELARGRPMEKILRQDV